MIRAMYTAGTGMQAQQLNIDVIANNLANVNTTGYKRSRPDFQDLLYQTLRLPGTTSQTGDQVPTGIQLGLGTKPAAVSKIFIEGDMQQTQNELDLAIQGKGFFQVLRPDGTTAFTRAGAFKVDNTGRFVTSDGFPMTPTITIPNDVMSISIDQQGRVSVLRPGSVTPTIAGTITLANFLNPAGLAGLGNNLYMQTDASGTPRTGNPGTNELGTIQQGFLEISNVSVVEELTNMILAQRAYEVNSKAIQTADEMLQIANNTKR
ncbi:MAG: flagellar basal-body rod protein FlgG [Nitrospinae bacterium]|nr:flagellar basal-body rod protein FlgG [Nitrospinota bacterium]